MPALPQDSVFILEDLHTSFGKFRERPMFADDRTDTAHVLFALAFGLVGSRYAHPLDAQLGLTEDDLAVLERVSEVSFVRSSAILRIDESRGPMREYK